MFAMTDFNNYANQQREILLAMQEVEHRLKADIVFNSTKDRDDLVKLTQKNLNNHSMSLIENMYFFNKLKNRAAYFSGSLYSNG